MAWDFDAEPRRPVPGGAQMSLESVAEAVEKAQGLAPCAHARTPAPAAAAPAALGETDADCFAVAMPNLVRHFPRLERVSPSLRNALLVLTALTPPHALEDDLEEEPSEGGSGRRRLTVVLDLDETLVHCRLERLDTPRYDLAVNFEEVQSPGYVYVRPFAQLFLAAAAELFEVVVFTASAASYADQVLDFLDPQGKFISRRMYRQDCTEHGGAFLKDLRVLGRPLSRIVLVDNSPASLALCPDNGVIVRAWTADTASDRELFDLLLLLRQCAESPSVPAFLRERYGVSAFVRELQERLAMSALVS